MSDQLELLLEDGVINEILGHMKSGKEAEVYLVRRGTEILAAKIYKGRDERTFKNNSAYKEERKVRNSRTQRALSRGSRFGKHAEEETWKSAEATALSRLHALGLVRVPAPVMFYEGVLLMQLVTGPEGYAAPRLIDASLSQSAAAPLYHDLRRQLIGMLCSEVIHGDLSPYNILLGAEGPTIIDFPQMISAAHNRQAEAFFLRDFDNLFHFFSRLDRGLLPLAGDGREIWRAYLRRDLTADFVPPVPRFVERRPPDLARPAQQRPQGPPGPPRPPSPTGPKEVRSMARPAGPAAPRAGTENPSPGAQERPRRPRRRRRRP